MDTIYRQFEVEGSNYRQLTHQVVEEERPPMIEVEAYLARRKVSK